MGDSKVAEACLEITEGLWPVAVGITGERRMIEIHEMRSLMFNLELLRQKIVLKKLIFLIVLMRSLLSF